ncbi:hypothetical protein D3OALGA1CA_738 [Olavius algarvensis associated proteobacterium Delta 3]|nr:hypothetical protein D3OALGB2SA_61 [Olavius algarvensis associated proteobacterium Delta 3]CAB5088420.1 hypothetical protein D3OALGA1CA_738 [Olavius algarvensis associated proteobacterium Delta 3]
MDRQTFRSYGGQVRHMPPLRTTTRIKSRCDFMERDGVAQRAKEFTPNIA